MKKFRIRLVPGLRSVWRTRMRPAAHEHSPAGPTAWSISKTYGNNHRFKSTKHKIPNKKDVRYIIQLCLGSSSGSNSGQGLWIRIHFLRIRIQLFFSTRIRIYCRCGSSFLKLQCDFKLSFEKSKYKFFPLEPHSECDLDQKGILKKIFLYTKIKKKNPPY